MQEASCVIGGLTQTSTKGKIVSAVRVARHNRHILWVDDRSPKLSLSRVRAKVMIGRDPGRRITWGINIRDSGFCYRCEGGKLPRCVIVGCGNVPLRPAALTV